MPKYKKDDNSRGFIDPGDPHNPDPVQHSWNPGSVEQQRAHYRPDADEYIPTAVELVDAYDAKAKAKPEREGPDYLAGEVVEEDGDDSYWIRLSYSDDLIPTRTRWILQYVLPTALRSFVRHNLTYGNTDETLGLQGQFAEIHHITAKLKRTIWNRRNPTNVVGNEVQQDLESLIGHALLALELLEKENYDGR